jgi:hypothetical protein
MAHRENARHRPDGDCFSCARLLADDKGCALIVDGDRPRAAFLAIEYREGSDPHRACDVHETAKVSVIVERLMRWSPTAAEGKRAVTEFAQARRKAKRG